ncbi:type III secretion protein [Ralstonia sp. A12]|uniref:type III secretion protein n=1 Tax=Ralstonia sp. A12 TaxID=1217052 RepID=UPI000574871B|nr:type III secretion protein [Ralstonia sp. A12]KHK49853.1 type III secretion protein [Ralstonia sp. A12]
MTRKRSHVWHTLIEAKTRQRRRVETEINAAQQAVADALAALQDRVRACERAHDRLRAHVSRTDALIAAPVLLADAYLRYDAFRGELDNMVMQAERAVAAAHAAVAEREAELQARRQALARLDAMLEQCRKTAERIDQQDATERELATEEEAVEALLARARHLQASV